MTYHCLLPRPQLPTWPGLPYFLGWDSTLCISRVSLWAAEIALTDVLRLLLKPFIKTVAEAVVYVGTTQKPFSSRPLPPSFSDHVAGAIYPGTRASHPDPSLLVTASPQHSDSDKVLCKKPLLLIPSPSPFAFRSSSPPTWTVETIS